MMIRAGDNTGAAGNTNTSYYTINTITNYPNPNKVSLSLVSSLHSQVDLYIEVTFNIEQTKQISVQFTVKFSKIGDNECYVTRGVKTKPAMYILHETQKYFEFFTFTRNN